MRHLPIFAIVGTLLGMASPALAQEPAASASSDTITFDLAEVEEEDDGDWGIGEFLASQREAEAQSCGTDSDLLAAQSTSRPRYDDNGALIRETPSAACVPPGSRYGTLGQAVRAEEQRRAQAGSGDSTAFLRQPDCVENASGYRCAASGMAGRNTFEREEECRETGTSRTCSSTFSIGSSSESRNAAEEAVERMLRD